MGLFDFFKKKKTTERVGGMEDFMTLIRVYYQSVLASNLGISNVSMLPDLATFKRTLKVATQNNKLGVAEKSRCKKMQDAQTYLFAVQGFNNDLMMLVGNLMKWKFRVPGFMHKMLRGMTEKIINDILTKNNWKDEATFRTVYSVRQYREKLGHSPEWMTEYVYKIVTLAKKEPRPKAEDLEKK